MSILTVVDGIEYQGFIGISAVDNIESLCNQYRQRCSTETGGSSFPIKRGSSVQIYIEGTKVFDGHCEISDSQTGKGKYSVTSEGRDINRAIMKSSLDPSVNIKGPISLVSVITKTLKASGFEREIIDNTGGLDDLTRKELLNDDVGTDMWEYWLELARKRQCLITDDWDGNIVLFRPGTLKYNYKLVNTINDTGGRNNIIESALRCDDSERCHKYVVHSQYNFSVKRKKTLPEPGQQAENIFDTAETDSKPDSERVQRLKEALAASDVGSEEYSAILVELANASGTGAGERKRRSRINTQGVAYDYAIPPGSTKHIVADRPSDDDECERLAKWHANLARAKSVKYTCSVPFLTVDGSPWRSGYLIDVNDEDQDVDATMLITQVEPMVSKSEGGAAEEIVNLTMTVPDAYSVDDSADESLIRINRIGGNWNEEAFL